MEIIMDLYCQLQDFASNFQLELWLQAVKKKKKNNLPTFVFLLMPC